MCILSECIQDNMSEVEMNPEGTVQVVLQDKGEGEQAAMVGWANSHLQILL